MGAIASAYNPENHTFKKSKMSCTLTVPSPLKSERRQGFGEHAVLEYHPSGRAWHWLDVAVKHTPVVGLQHAPVSGAHVCGVHGTLSPR